MSVQLATAKVAFLLSQRAEGTDLTCMLVRVPVGTDVERHTQECDDIIYALEGKATLWIEGVGNVLMVLGTFVRIPAGVAHQPYNIEEDLVVYDVFYLYLV